MQSPREWETQTLGELGELGVHPGVCVRGPLPTTSFVVFFSAGAIVIDGICTPLCRRSQAGSFARQSIIIRQRLGFVRVGLGLFWRVELLFVVVNGERVQYVHQGVV